MSNKNEWTSPRRLYLDADGKVVEANDRSRASLLVGAGGSIPLSRAVELGLASAEPEPEAEVFHVEQPVTETEPEPDFDPFNDEPDPVSEPEKAVQPAKDKAKKPGKDKAKKPGKDKAK